MYTCRCGEKMEKVRKHCPECGAKIEGGMEKAEQELNDLLGELVDFAKAAQAENLTQGSDDFDSEDGGDLELNEALVKANNILAERADRIEADTREVSLAVGKVANAVALAQQVTAKKMNALAAQVDKIAESLNAIISQPGKARSAVVSPLIKSTDSGRQGEEQAIGPQGEELVKAAIDWEVAGLLNRNDATQVDYLRQRGVTTINAIAERDRALAGRLVQAFRKTVVSH